MTDENKENIKANISDRKAAILAAQRKDKETIDLLLERANKALSVTFNTSINALSRDGRMHEAVVLRYSVLYFVITESGLTPSRVAQFFPLFGNQGVTYRALEEVGGWHIYDKGSYEIYKKFKNAIDK